MRKDLRFVFVCGAERTGTTLLERILCTDPSVVPVVGELPIVAALLACTKAAAGQFDFFYRDYLASPAALQSVALAGIEVLARSIAARHRKSRVLVIKSPGLTPHVFDLAGMFPTAPILVLRRDPLDAVASLRRVAERARSSGSHHELVRAVEDVESLANRFLSFYRPLMAGENAEPGSVSFVGYEDLVQAPGREIDRLGRILGLELRLPDSGDPSLGSSYLTDADRPYWSDLYRCPVSREAVGTHEGALSAADAATVLARTLRYREWAGYGQAEGERPGRT